MFQLAVKFSRLLLVPSLLSVMAITPASALEGEPATQFVLEGMKDVHVSVGSMKDLTIDRQAIQKSVEAKFEAAGLKTIGEKEFLNNTTINRFLIKVLPLKNKKRVFYSLSLSLTEMVFLEDKADRKISVTAWQDNAVGLAEPGAQDQITKKIMERVDAFIDLWQRANGEEKTK